MRRPTDLTVGTTPTTPDITTSPTSECKVPISPRSSVHSIGVPSVIIPPPSPPQPSIRLLFSLLTRRDFLVFVLPAVLTSLLAGGIAPFMTLVVGMAFDAYSEFTVASDHESAKHVLLHDVGMTAVELLALAVGALALSSVMSSLWIWTGERNLMAVRKQVYDAVSKKDMVWYDTKMGGEDSVTSTEGDGPVGAGGLMAQFARETDDVRMASSLASGLLIQYLTTTLTCLVLALVRSWSLTLIILSTVPVMMILQTLSQALAGPALGRERMHIASVATLVDRAVAAIATVKAFNAEAYEQESIGRMLNKMQTAAVQCIRVWGITGGLSQFAMMTMFVQAFWFGSKLVRSGKISMGDVTAVFWACLIASSNLQMCIPQFIVLAKGKFAMASLMGVVDSTPSVGRTNSVALKNLSRRPTNLRKIVPRGCQGGIELTGVTFYYPSRPSAPALDDVSLFLPAGETTFIVGGSGSGKSTIAHLLLRLYDTYSGTIALDDQDLAYLDENWTRQHISAVSQNTILFDMTVHENVAMGLAGPYSTRRPEDVTRQEVEDVCRTALVHDFVRDLPQGYDTPLGSGGANLSGGQKQRLAIARAILRNPTVLILDEATSALDATSRVLVLEALKRNRHNKSTVVITHDLSQICSGDFVYVLKDGELVEQGFRSDLERHSSGEFRRMASVQGALGGFPQRDESDGCVEVEAILERQDEEKTEEFESIGIDPSALHQPSVYRPITVSNWMLDVIADLTKPAPTLNLTAPREPHRVSRFVPAEAFTATEEPTSPTHRRSLHVSIPSPALMPSSPNRRFSLPVTPTSPTNHSAASIFSTTVVNDDDDLDADKQSVFTLEKAGNWSTKTRGEGVSSVSSIKRPRMRWDAHTLNELSEVKVDQAPAEDVSSPPASYDSFFGLMRDTFRTMPCKPLLFIGLLVCLISGAMTPIFSYLLSRLLYEVSIGATNVSTINLYGGIVLAVAATDGFFFGAKFVIMEILAVKWVISLRRKCIKLILAQDKKWFDKSENSPSRLMQVLIKDGDDARTLVASVVAQFCVVVAMLGLGLIWALALGWQLTLVGVAIAPVFAATMAVQTKLVSKCAMRNKRAREEVATGYYDAISNVRAIRAMGFEAAFQEKFDKSVDRALSTGVRGAFVEGCTYGVASALIYLAEALLFYVGAVLIANGTYTYLRMIQVLNLVVFSVSLGSQLLAFTSRITKSVQATRDLLQLLNLSSDTEESRGTLQPPILGNISFHNVSFSYPERPDVPILKDLSLELHDGECVAVVGSSGSGKSTVASLLQRLYEPSSGSIYLGPNLLNSTDVHHLREHVAVVSQHPNLFDATIAANIAYGNSSLTQADIEAAAKAANVHDFIVTLPKGYETMVGENASLISGGQAQRLSIARALVRPSRILILDECTSALDPENQAAVMETIKHAKVGRTTLMVTHKLPVMRMCDRIVVIHDGVVAEQGTYDELISRRGVFATLASGGEWMD
ncbi:P-loop containing nucleoside triphosphate hydrolase protein [Cristinia sonorae]|uniref:P-loop containing nucleoside triphosphate hydrolase protein n=1 Tax=Cristinia sonorae TaxID=1940300 RepID=A0A8K0UQD9_9AGAR|nr:P-loop containing nucleoside triphosphate hydrolase protein [Cristinia sonorae]